MLVKTLEIIDYLTDYTQQKNDDKNHWYIGICQEAHDIVFEAIKNDFFYILTDASFIFKKLVQKRMEGILEAFQQNKPIIKQVK